MHRDGGKVFLRSIIHPHVWPHAEKSVAICRVGRHHFAPNRKCSCGIYGSTNPDELRYYASSTAKPFAAPHIPSTPRAFGLVNMWGRVIRASTGYRAMFVYPKELFLPCPSHEFSDALGAYGVPITCVSEEDAFQALLQVSRTVREQQRKDPD